MFKSTFVLAACLQFILVASSSQAAGPFNLFSRHACGSNCDSCGETACGCKAPACGCGEPVCGCEAIGCADAPGCGQVGNGCDRCGDAGCCDSGCDGLGCGSLQCGSTLRDLLVGSPCDRKYVSLFGGWNALHDYNGNNGPPLRVSGSFNDGWAIGGAVGREIGNSFRGEFEFAFRDNTGDNWIVNGAGGKWSGHANVYSSMSNLYYDFDFGRKIKPYIGGGIGFAVVNANLTTSMTTVDVDDTAFAYQAIVGVAKSVSNRADAFIEYRYFGLNGVDVVNQGAGFTFQGEDFESENLFVGLRFYR